MKKALIILSTIALLACNRAAVAQSVQPRFTEMLTAEEQEKDEWLNKISQIDSLENFYIELVSTKKKDDYALDYICVQIFEKPGRKFVQEIDLSEYPSCNQYIDGGDFNFDGWEDFSLFICSYAGPNTSSYYFLYDPEKKEFFDSEFSGVSLEFNYSNQTIYERNQCCAGSSVHTNTYIVIDNKMVMIERHCFEADQEKLANEEEFDFLETDCDGNFLTLQLKSVGLKKNFRLQIAIFEDNLIGGNVLYKGQTERIPIRLDHSEIAENREEEGRPNVRTLFYNELYNGEITGVYTLKIQGAVVYGASYIRRKDNKTFNLEVINE